jgi:hypothetical protein
MSHFIYCYAECHYAECRYSECCYAQCHYAECRGALKTGTVAAYVFYKLGFIVGGERRRIKNSLKNSDESSSV